MAFVDVTHRGGKEGDLVTLTSRMKVGQCSCDELVTVWAICNTHTNTHTHS